MISCFFFFQAEDGIRDLVRSRGLGDVYKRQLKNWFGKIGIDYDAYLADPALEQVHFIGKDIVTSVSYTHLTLPTSDLV